MNRRAETKVVSASRSMEGRYLYVSYYVMEVSR